MMSKKPLELVGKPEEIQELLLKCMGEVPWKLEKTERGSVYIKFGDDTEYQKAYDAWDKRTEKLYSQERNKALCNEQLRGWGLTPRPWGYTIGTNIYGWVAGCHAKSNIQGGRFGETARGATLAQVITYGVEKAKIKNTTFKVAIDQLPETHVPDIIKMLQVTL